jgi:ACS family tartrate transporter-like MFS transporter
MAEAVLTGVMDAESAVGQRAMRRITNRLIIFLGLCYFISYLDRVNVGFAALTMNKDIGLSATAFGLGGGLFFIGYFLFGVPSNIMLERIGARRWMAILMVCWGFASMGMSLVQGPTSFGVARLIVGLAEAGFYPGVILYFTYWVPKENRAKLVGMFSLAGPVATMTGAPLSSHVIEWMNGVNGMAGWQWMFILEAAPAVLLGIAAIWLLPDRPAQAAWLAADERVWLEEKLREEREAVAAQSHINPPWWQPLLDVDVLVLGLLYTGATVGTYGMSLWLPTIIKSHGMSTTETGWLTSIPFGLAALGMVLWGAQSDKAGERMWHTIACLLLAATGLTASIFAALYSDGLLLVMVSLTAATVGVYSLRGPFWALCTQWLPAATAGAGFAAINAIGNLGGFVGPFAIGAIKDKTGSYALTTLPLIAFGIMAVSVTLLRYKVRQKKL